MIQLSSRSEPVIQAFRMLSNLPLSWRATTLPLIPSGSVTCSTLASFATSDFEDTGVGQALQFLSQAGRADQNRLLVLRSASDYTVQPQGQTPAQFLASENSGGLSGFQEALNDVYQVGSIVVKKLSFHWDTYANQIPSPASLSTGLVAP